jgi:hypothetical protein
MLLLQNTSLYSALFGLDNREYLSMLISLWTGRKPTLRTFEMLCWYFTGMASEKELLAHLQRLQKVG